MTNIVTIRQNADNREKRLCRIYVGRATAVKFLLPHVSHSLNNVQIHIGTVESEETTAAGANIRPDGSWSAYVNGAYFPRVGETKYHVTARDSNLNSVYLGCGDLIITPSVLNVEETTVPTIPKDTYLRGTDGRYYPLTIEFDDDGTPIPTIGEGITK